MLFVGSFTTAPLSGANSNRRPKKRQGVSQMKDGKNGNGTAKSLKGGLAGQDPKESLKQAAAKVAASKKPPELKLPPKERPDMTALELLDLQEDEAFQTDSTIAAEVGKWMEGESLPNLDKIDAKVKKLGPKVLELVAYKAEDGRAVTFREQRAEYVRCNEEYLSAAIPVGETADGTPFLIAALKTRKAAHMAVLRHRLHPEMDRDQLLETVADLMKQGYLKEDSEGFIRLWQKRYALLDDEKSGCLGEEEEKMLAEIFGNHVNRLNSTFKGDVLKKVEEMRKASSLTLLELLKGKQGKCLIHAPTQMRGTYRLSEVYVLLKGDGEGRAFILDAAGPDENKAFAIQERKLFLWLSSLDVPRPPRVETLMDKGFVEEDATLLRIFWGYVDRARCAQDEKERRQREKELIAKAEQEEKETFEKASAQAEALMEEYAQEATISLDRILMEMEPMQGVFFAQFKGDWRNPNGTIIPNGLLFFLGEQKVVDGKASLKVKKAPDHLIGRFFKETNMEFAFYGPFFSGLDQPLQGLMKALHRQIKREIDETQVEETVS